MLLCHKFKPFFELLDDRYNEKYKDIRYVILVGGRGGAKSYALGTWVNTAVYKEGWGIYSTRWTMSSAEKSIIPQFKDICETVGNDRDFTFKRTQVVNNKTGVVIDYSGIKPQSNQSTGDSKSLAKKNILIVEEAEDVHDFDLFDKVDNSIRTIEQKNIVILCLNQGHIHHWIHKEFIAEERDDVMIIETTYLDNLKYLDDSFIKKADRVKKRDYKKYEHVYLNKWKSDVDGALWLDCDISPYREMKSEFDYSKLREIVVAYDPAVTDTEKPLKERTKTTGNEPDEDGIVVCGKDNDGRFYVIGDHSCRGKRIDLANKLIELYHEYDAKYIVIEKNNGGDWIPSMVKMIDPHVRIKTVTATKGKALRAGPVQAVYEDGKVSHVGYYPELEYEMTCWVPDSNMPSPNRIDAMVWGMTALFKTKKIIMV